MIPSRGGSSLQTATAAGAATAFSKFLFFVLYSCWSAILVVPTITTNTGVVQAQNDFDVGGCAGLMPYCTHPIFKCGDEAPICGGSVKDVVENCTSNLFICNPIKESNDISVGGGRQQEEEEEEEEEINYNLIIYDLDGPDEVPKEPYVWPGWSFYSDVCSQLRRARPNCGKTKMMYQCDERPYCGAIDKERAAQLTDPDLLNCYRLKLCAPLTAKTSAKVGMVDHLVDSTEDVPDMRDAPYWRDFFSSSATRTTTTTTSTTTVTTITALILGATMTMVAL